MAWFEAKAGRVNIEVIYLWILNPFHLRNPHRGNPLANFAGELPPMAPDLASELLERSLDSYRRINPSGLRLTPRDIAASKRRIKELAELVKAYVAPGRKLTAESSPLLRAYYKIKRNLKNPQEKEAILNSYSLLSPYLTLSIKGWIEELRGFNYEGKTQENQVFLLARALVIFFASAGEIQSDALAVANYGTLRLKRRFVDRVLDSIFLIEEGRINIPAQLKSSLGIKEKYKRDYLVSLKRNIHEVLTGAIGERRKRLSTSALLGDEIRHGERQGSVEPEYIASEEKLNSYLHKLDRLLFSSFTLALDAKNFLEGLSPEEKALVRILSKLKFRVKYRKEDYPFYSFLEEEIDYEKRIEREGVDAFYKYIASFLYWREYAIGENDILLTERQIKELVGLVFSWLSDLGQSIRTLSEARRNFYTLSVVLALSLLSGIAPEIMAEKLSLESEGPQESVESREKEREFSGIERITYRDGEGILKVVYSRRHSTETPEPKEIFRQAEDFWVVPVAGFLLPHLRNLFKNGNRPQLSLRGKKFPLRGYMMSRFLRLLSEEIGMPFVLTPLILRKTFVFFSKSMGLNPLVAYLLTGRLPLQLHAPFFYLNFPRERIWNHLIKWQDFLGVKGRDFPEKFRGRFGSRLCPRDEVLRENLRAWASALKWSVKRKLSLIRARIYEFLALQMLLLFTGARIGEILSLNWEDVDFHMGTLTLRGKNNLFYAEERLVPLSPLALASLKAYRSFLKRSFSLRDRKSIEKVLRGRVFKRFEEEGIFSYAGKTHYDYSTLRKDFEEIKAYLSLKKISGRFLPSERFHIYRHWFFSKCLEIDEEEFEALEAIMGHIGGLSIYLWKFETRHLREFLQRAGKLLLKLERELLGEGLREEILELLGEKIEG